jgi:hypothetical protein
MSSGKSLSSQVEQVTGQKVTKIRLTDNAVLVRVSFGRVGTQKKVSPDEIAVETEGNVKIQKRLLDSKEMKAIDRYDAQVKQYIAARTNRPKTRGRGREGLRFVGIKLVAEFDAKMKEFMRGRNEHVQNLKRAYAGIIENDRERLFVMNNGVKQSIFRASDYLPVDSFEEEFQFTCEYLELVAPRSMRAVSEDLYKQVEANIQRQAEEDMDAMRVALRVEFSSLVDWAINRLTPGENGKKKVFKVKGKDGADIGFAARLNDFISVFEGRDLSGDSELGVVIQKAREIMSGVDPKDLRSSEALRDSLRDQFSDIKTILDPWVVEEPSRKIYVE